MEILGAIDGREETISVGADDLLGASDGREDPTAVGSDD